MVFPSSAEDILLLQGGLDVEIQVWIFLYGLLLEGEVALGLGSGILILQISNGGIFISHLRLLSFKLPVVIVADYVQLLHHIPSLHHILPSLHKATLL